MERVNIGSVNLAETDSLDWAPLEARSFIGWLRTFTKEQRVKDFTFSHAQLRMIQAEATSRGLEFTADGHLVCPTTVQ